MHFMLGNIVDLHRQKRPGPDMQGHMGKIDAARCERVQQRRIEMQRGGGRSDSAQIAGPDGLIVFFILRVRLALGFDIGRQGHGACLGQRSIKIRACEIKGDDGLPLRLRQERGGEPVRKADVFALVHFFERFDQGAPGARRRGLRLKQGHLDLRLLPTLRRIASAFACEPRGQHLCVIEDEPIPGAQPIHQIGHRPIVERIRRRHEQSCGGSRFGRAGGDQRLGQIKIKVAQLHRLCSPSLPRVSAQLLIVPRRVAAEYAPQRAGRENRERVGANHRVRRRPAQRVGKAKEPLTPARDHLAQRIEEIDG